MKIMGPIRLYMLIYVSTDHIKKSHKIHNLWLCHLGPCASFCASTTRCCPPCGRLRAPRRTAWRLHLFARQSAVVPLPSARFGGSAPPPHARTPARTHEHTHTWLFRQKAGREHYVSVARALFAADAKAVSGRYRVFATGLLTNGAPKVETLFFLA